VQGNVNTYRRRVDMGWLTWFSARSERIALARARHVVAENEYSLAAARPMIRTQSVHVVEHPIRADFLSASPSDGTSKRVLFVGAIDERKGIWDALEAFRIAAPPDWQMVIAGSGRPERVAELQRRMAAPALAGRVTYHPKLDSAAIVTQMQAASVFLLPTRIDTGPTALKEVLAMGLWPVCYDNSGPGHYVRKFGFGTLAEDLNPAALTAALKRAIAERPWEQAEHRAKIPAQIRPHFSRALIWQDLLQVYRRVCES
jgi:glycosyltransferase involved in cell wall biosynthesis